MHVSSAFFLYIYEKNAYDKSVKIKLLKEKYLSNEGALFRYSLSYCLLLALLPTMMMFFMFYSDFSYVVSFLYQFIPQEFIDGYIEYLSYHQNENLLSLIFSFLLAGFVASKVFYSFMLLVMKDENYHLSLIIVVNGIIIIQNYGNLGFPRNGNLRTCKTV